MEEERLTGLYQLRDGVYVNRYGDAFCFVDAARFLILYIKSEYRVYAIGFASRDDTVERLDELYAKTAACALTMPPFENTCDTDGNKIEYFQQGGAHTITVRYRNMGDESGIVKLAEVHARRFIDEVAPPTYTRIVDKLAEPPIKVLVRSADSRYDDANVNVTLTISGTRLRTTERLIIAQLLAFRYTEVYYNTEDDIADAFVRANVPRDKRWSLNIS